MSRQRVTVREVETEDDVKTVDTKRIEKVKGFFEIVVDAINSYEKIITSDDLYNSGRHTGGKIRTQNGKLVENIVRNMLTSLCQRHHIQNFKIITGLKGGIKVESKRGSINAFVDVHLFVNDSLVLACECKAYLDDAFLTRADSVFRHFKNANPNTKRVIVSLENAIADNSLLYFLDQENVNDVFFLIDNKRDHKKPIWLSEHYKQINNIKMVSMVTYFDDMISKFK